MKPVAMILMLGALAACGVDGPPVPPPAKPSPQPAPAVAMSGTVSVGVAGGG